MPRLATPALVVACAIALLLVAGWLFYTSPAAQSRREVEARRAEALRSAGGTDGGAARAAPPRLTVEAVTARAESPRTTVELSGELEAVRHVVVGAEVPGRVVEIVAEEHAPVEAGAVLLRLDPQLPRAAVARARAALASAEARAGLAASDLARREELSAKGVASAAELDRARSEADTAAAGVAEARAALLDAETRLAKTTIRAPFAGVVAALDLEPGAYVQAGQPVAELFDLSAIEVEVGVSDQEILALSEGHPAEVRVEALPGRRFDGRVARPGRTADERTRKYPVPVRLANREGLLLHGMLGTVRFELGELEPVIRLPRRAVQREFELDYVFVLEPPPQAGADGAAAGDGAVASRRRVVTRPVPFRPELVEVTEGLAPGERVATSAVRELRDGLRVRTRPADAGLRAAAAGPEAGP